MPSPLVNIPSMVKKKKPPLTAEAREYFARAGRIGGKKRFKALTKEQKSELARKAAAARWGKKKGGSNG